MKKLNYAKFSKQGHERCWYYPYLFTKLANLFELKPTKNPYLPPLADFKKGCEKYQEEEYYKQKNLLKKKVEPSIL